MSHGKSHARKLAKRLIQENRNGRSWRDIAQEDYPMVRADGSQIVKAGTLNRIAKSGGAWLPKSKEILAALGLSKVRSKFPRPAWLLRWYRLPKDERWKVMENYLKGNSS